MNTSSLIDRLFTWKSSFAIGDVTLYIRVVSDAVLEDAKNAALLASRKMRKGLRDSSSDLYLLHLDAASDATDDELIAYIVNTKARDVARSYINMNPRPVVEPLGDFPTQEEQEAHQQALEDRETEYFNALEQHIAGWQADYMIVVKRMKREELEATYRKERTDKVCEEEFTKVFENFVLAASVFEDQEFRKRAFTYEQYLNLPSSVRDTIRDQYNAISLTNDDVKN